MLSVPFLLVFVAGLGVAVYSMLQGVTPGPTAGVATRVGTITAPSVAAFAVTFGAIGYLCTTRTSVSYPLVLVIALVGGGATIPLTAPLLAKLTRTRADDSSNELELEGQPARVMQTITESIPGEIAYEREGKEFRHRALNLIEGVLVPGRDVIIDRMEGGVAYVEDWDRVERRL